MPLSYCCNHLRYCRVLQKTQVGATYFLAQAVEPVAVDGPVGAPGGEELPRQFDGWDPPQILHTCTQRQVVLLHMSPWSNAKHGLAVG